MTGIVTPINRIENVFDFFCCCSSLFSRNYTTLHIIIYAIVNKYNLFFFLCGCCQLFVRLSYIMPLINRRDVNIIEHHFCWVVDVENSFEKIIFNDLTNFRFVLFCCRDFYSLHREEEGGGGHTTVHMENEKRMRREIANSNERRRMQSINAGFQSLRSLLPHHEGEKLSKVCILYRYWT